MLLGFQRLKNVTMFQNLHFISFQVWRSCRTLGAIYIQRCINATLELSWLPVTRWPVTLECLTPHVTRACFRGDPLSARTLYSRNEKHVEQTPNHVVQTCPNSANAPASCSVNKWYFFFFQRRSASSGRLWALQGRCCYTNTSGFHPRVYSSETVARARTLTNSKPGENSSNN